MSQALELQKRLAVVSCNLMVQEPYRVAHVIDFEDGSHAVLTHDKDIDICQKISDVIEAFPAATVRAFELTVALERIVQTADQFLICQNTGDGIEAAVHDVCKAMRRASTNKAANVGPAQIDHLARTFWTTMIRYQYPEMYGTSVDPQRAEAEWDSWESGTMNQDAIKAGVARVVDYLTRVT